MKTADLILIRLRLSNWGGTRINREEGRKVAASSNADEEAVAVVVRALSKNDRKALDFNSHMLRHSVHFYSLPWEDGGWRVLRAAKLREMEQRIEKLRAEREELIAHFVRDYDVIKDAAKKRLGKLWEEDRFPPREELPDRFAVRVLYRPVVSSEDIRISGDEETVEHIRKQVTEQQESALKEATGVMLGELKEMTAKLVDRVRDRDQKRARYASICKSIEKTCAALDNLNLTGDKKIADAIEAVRNLAKADPKHLRESGRARGKVATEGDAITATLNSLF